MSNRELRDFEKTMIRHTRDGEIEILQFYYDNT